MTVDFSKDWWIETTHCSECGKSTRCVLSFAIAPGDHHQMKCCGDCMQAILQHRLRPGTKRVVIAGQPMGEITAYQLLMDGQAPDGPPTTEQMMQCEPLYAELCRMIRADPHRGTENESVFFRETREPARQIGQKLYDMGGHPLMIEVYNMIRRSYPVAARHLEIAWSGIGEWFD